MKHFFIIMVMFLLTFCAYAQKKAEKSPYDKALTKIENENFEGAIADLNKAIETDPLHHAAYYKRGLVKALMLDHEGALADFDHAIEINPRESQYFSERGIARMNLGDREGACAGWKRASSMGSEPAKELAYEYCPD